MSRVISDLYGINLYGQYGYKGIQTSDDPEPVAGALFRWLPDWSEPVVMSYRYDTVITHTDHHVEQRRARWSVAKRAITFRVWLDEQARGIEHWLRVKHGTIIFVPVWQEPLTIETEGSLAGVSSLTLSSIANKHNARHLSTYFALIDRSGVIDPEVLTASAIADTTLTLESAITGAHTAAGSYLFPAMCAYFEQPRLNDVTAHVVEHALTFREWF